MINLEDIKDPSFVKTLSIKELKELAIQIREFLIENVSKTGGHLSSNLGVVELTIAMYYVFDPEKDKFLFDVGHQSYVHKILTGRAKDFKNLRRYDGLSGYINKNESKYDVWESGHSSTSISAMSGMLLSSVTDGRVISFIGDSSIMNGVAFEGLNYLGQLKNKNPIIILNDNKMGISKTVGSLTKAFEKFRRSKIVRLTKSFFNKIFPTFITSRFHQLKRGIKATFQQDNIFEDLGFDYYGPYDGNDIRYCIKSLKKIKDCKEPIIIHFITKKGKGYPLSESDSIGDFHGVEPFDIKTGKPLKEKNLLSHSYSEIVAKYLEERYKRKPLFVITPAMKVGQKLAELPENNDFIDVGIAEEHASDMAAGIALNKKDVVVLMYSTFSQRAYDEILNDISRQNLKVVFGIDRAGIVGEDGETHAGIYDISMFMSMPNIKIAMGIDGKETIGLFNYALDRQDNPMVIRYPRGCEEIELSSVDYDYIVDFSWSIIKEGNSKILISYGPDLKKLKKIVEDNNLDIMIVNARFIKPMDNKMLDELFSKKLPIYVFEQTINSGSLYHNILDYKELNNYNSKVYHLSLEVGTKVKFGKINDVLDSLGLSDEDILEWLQK